MGWYLLGAIVLYVFLLFVQQRTNAPGPMPEILLGALVAAIVMWH